MRITSLARLFFNMEKQVLRLVKNKRLFYVPSIKDYEVLIGIGTPLLKLNEVELPLLKARCKIKKVELKVKDFSVFENFLIDRIKKDWEFTFTHRGDTLLVEIPRKKSALRKATSLVSGIKGFYGRHLFDVDIKVRKFSQKVRFIIERSFNEQKEPEWRQ